MRKSLGTLVGALVCAVQGFGAGIPEPVTYRAVVEYLREHPQVRTIEALLPELPDNFRAAYVLMHTSKSRQGASSTNPRVILFGGDAKLLMTFTGDPKLPGHDVIETMEFQPATRTFELHEIAFPGDRPPIPSAANPRACLSCHGRDPRPNWDGYPKWPGTYGPDHDRLSSAEPEIRQAYRELAASAEKHPRYRYLRYLKTVPETQNADFTQRVGMYNMQRVARLMTSHPLYPKLKYALLVAATCSASVAEAVPDSLRERFDDYVSATQELSARMGDLYDQIDNIYPFLSRVGVNTEFWSMDFNFDPGFSTPGQPNHEFLAWWAKADPEIEKLLSVEPFKKNGAEAPRAYREASCTDVIQASRARWR